MSAHLRLQAAHQPLSSAYLKFLRTVDDRVLKGSEHRGPTMALKTLIVDYEPIALKVLR
jgi:hypothetical protein